MTERLRRWLRSTSNRSFILWPVLLVGWQALLDGGWPQLDLRALPLLAWGYLQYRWVGALRSAQGGGGPGLSNPPLRIVRTGIYGWTRNPMYLGHLIFLAGLALLVSGIGWAVLIVHMLWFDRRVRRDEQHLLERFGAPYRDYLARVRRWVPGLY